MFEPLYVAATGMNVFQDEMVDITNNLSNAQTVAFKKGRTEKESLFTIERTRSAYPSRASSERHTSPRPATAASKSS